MIKQFKTRLICEIASVLSLHRPW